MKYFNPSYWFKLWMLTVPFFQDKNQGINANSIDNKKIKDWVSNNTNLQSINQDINFTNLNTNYQPYNLNQQLPNQNIDLFYQTKLQTSTHKHRHEKHRNRKKRTLNGGNEIIGNWGKVTCSFTPKIFERLIKYYYGGKDLSNGQIFRIRMKRLYDGKGIDHNDNSSTILITATFPWTWEEIENIGESFYKNFLNIEKVYTNSSKRERIETKFTYYRKVEFKSVRIITEDMGYYPNNFLDNLERDFPDWNKNIEINLGKINDNVDNEIKSVINKKYPNLKFHCINIFDKQSSYFLNSDKKTNSFGGFSAKILSSTNVGTDCYSYGPTKPTFIYVTQYKLNEISNIIANDLNVKQWLTHINEWNSTLPQAINNSKTFTPQALYNWKRQEKEIIKGYIRDWSYVSTLIEHELKLDELNKNIQGIKSDFESIKNQINELDNRVRNLENQSSLNCENILTIVSGALSTIPVIGNVAGGIIAMTSGTCAIAGI